MFDLWTVFKRLFVGIFCRRQRPDDWAFLVGGQGWMAVGSLIEFPSIILAALRRRRLVVDFFPVVLTDIGDKQIARFLVEMEHVRIAKAISPDLWARADLVLSEPLIIDADQSLLLCLVCFGERI